MAPLFGQLLNRLQRGYGQIDKNVFGGLLPGGAATPIGAVYQRANIPRQAQPSGLTRRKAALVDAFTTGVARAQPVVEQITRNAPRPVQEAISSGLNLLPFSANLLGRYYTGIGGQGLQIPREITETIAPIISAPGYREKHLTQAKEAEKFLARELANPSPMNANVSWGRQLLNDRLAETRSAIQRMERGDVPFNGYGLSSTSPLSSLSTSVGSAWFTPTGNQGFTAKETYDFQYGGADKEQKIGPGLPFLSPSQGAAFAVVEGVPGAPSGSKKSNKNVVPPEADPLTFLGRSVVMKMPDRSFDYPINVR